MKFTKMQGIGNDYVYINAIEQKIEDPSKLANKISDRHFGIGSDGLILIRESDVADFRMQMFNSDGSEAEMCGNGIRCVGKFVYDKGLTNKETLKIETLAGIKILKLNIKDGKVDTVRVDMGEPILIPNEIPVISNEDIVKDLPIDIYDKSFKFTCVSMGNPHAVTFIKENVQEYDVSKYGKEIEVNKAFPKKTNVEFINVIDKKNIKMRVWERGAGETLACGTGACASTVAAILNGYTDNTVNVELRGGILQIEWNKEDNHVYMTGSATNVFEGYIEEI
ncbi:MAG: diaminopimelate epimerase [Clostridia bacterium]|nr:diaminopimelate epimerase [Clostridia bacterium]